MVGHLLLYQPAIRWLKTYLAAGELGDIYSFHQERLNLGLARPVENALWSLGVHDVAVLLYLNDGEPSHLQVTGQCALSPHVEDDVRLSLEFPTGIRRRPAPVLAVAGKAAAADRGRQPRHARLRRGQSGRGAAPQRH